jgi:hypothetical protein
LIKLFIVLIVFTSCGARKSSSSTQDIKIEETTKVTEEISQVSEKSETLVDTTSTIEETYEPINDSLPFTVNGKQYKNVRITKKKTKNGITTLNKENNVLNQRKNTLNEVSADIETNNKEVDRKESGYSWLWLIIIAGAILIYLDYKKK